MTQHCLERTRERMHLSYRAASKIISRAAEYGQTPEKFPARERAYLHDLTTEGKEVVVYSNYCFIFGTDCICITVFPVPVWFGKKSNYNGKIQIRNPKKYQHYCGKEF